MASEVWELKFLAVMGFAFGGKRAGVIERSIGWFCGSAAIGNKVG
jgi:hypothetical protein